MIYPLKINAKNLAEIEIKYPKAKIKEIGFNFNMLFIKDNQTAVITESKKYYLITH
jgi:hypothetical protein